MLVNESAYLANEFLPAVVLAGVLKRQKGLSLRA